MSNGSIKVMAIIAVILQALATVLGFGMVAMQKTLLHAFMRMPDDLSVTVFPMTLIFVVVQLIIYIVFLSISKKEGNRVVGIILIVLSIVLSVVSIYGSVLVNIFYSRQGAAALGAYSSITTLINYVNTLLVIPAKALFYIACGRYTAK